MVAVGKGGLNPSAFIASAILRHARTASGIPVTGWGLHSAGRLQVVSFSSSNMDVSPNILAASHQMIPLLIAVAIAMARLLAPNFWIACAT